MRILLTNDDGIDAPGLAALRNIAAELSEDVWVVAPETNQSGTGHSLSLHEPLRMRRIDDQAYAVRGTPTDSVIMAVRHVLGDKRPDLVLSGVNRGANMAEDVTYSGTIAGAIEGTLCGIRSIALSQAYGTSKTPPWETAIKKAPGIIRQLLDVAWPEGTLMNVNFPDRRPDELAGIRVTRQGRRDPGLLSIDARHDTWGEPYYWLAYERRRSVGIAAGSDLEAVYNGFISITPLHIDLTHVPLMHAIEQRLAGA